MLRFAKRLFVFILLGLAGLAGLSRLLAPWDSIHVHGPEYFRIHQLLQKIDRTEVLLLGNSHSLAVELSQLGPNSYTLWQPGIGFADCEYQLRALLLKAKNLRIVLIPVGFFSLHFESDNSDTNRAYFTESEYLKMFERNTAVAKFVESEKERPGVVFFSKDSIGFNSLPELGEEGQAIMGRSAFLERREKYYRVLTSAWVPGDELRYWRSRLNPHISLVRSDRWRTFLEGLLSGLTGQRSPGPNRYGIDAYGQSRPEAASGILPGTHFRHQALLADTFSLNPNAVDDNKRRIREIASRLEEKNVELILFTPPYYADYVEQFDKRIAEEMKEAVMELDGLPNVHYWDFSTHRDFTDPLLFRDEDHLSEQGAIQFTKLLKTHCGHFLK